MQGDPLPGRESWSLLILQGLNYPAPFREHQPMCLPEQVNSPPPLPAREMLGAGCWVQGAGCGVRDASLANEPMEGAWEVVSTTNPQSNEFEYESLAREISNIKINSLVFLWGVSGNKVASRS